MLDFNCSGCGHTYQLPEKYAGKKARCKKCNKMIRIPVNSKSPDLIDSNDKDELVVAVGNFNNAIKSSQ